MQRFKNILCVVGIDLKDNAVLERAVKLAENNQASLTVVSVIDEVSPNITLLGGILSAEDFQAEIMADCQKRLEELIAPWSEKIVIKSKVLIGISFIEIIRAVLRNGYDLVLKMSIGGGVLNRVFGSDDMHLLRKCPCPVWLVKPKALKAHQRVLAAVDVDENFPAEELDTRDKLNIQILEMASSLALSESAELHIVHAWDAMGEGMMRGGFMARPEEEVVAYVEEVRQQHSQRLSVLMDKITDKLGRDALEYFKPQTHLLKGHPRKNVPEFAEKVKADLVIMGTVARTGIQGFIMGNTAENILNQLDCSVLAVKPPGFVTPVTLDG